MIITGNQYLKVAAQSGDFDFYSKFSVDNITGSVVFGISGTSPQVWNLESGRILHSGKVVSSYDANRSIELYARFNCNDQYDYWINGEPKSFENSLGTGRFDRIVANAANCNFNLIDFGFSGNTSILTIETPKLILTTGFNASLFNSDNTIPCQIFDITTSNNYGVTISGWTSGEFASSGDIYMITPSLITQNVAVPLAFKTNLGYFTLNFTGYSTGAIPQRTINFIGTKNEYSPGDSGSYTLMVYNNTTGIYDVYLDYSRDEGNKYGVGFGTGIGTGYFGTGDIGTVSGSKVVYSDYLTGYLDLYTVNGISQNVLAEGRGYANVYATGNAVYSYDLQAIGYHFGSIATGMITGLLTGVVNDGSGYYHFDRPVVGVPAIAVTATGIITSALGSFTGFLDDNLIVVGTRNGNFTGEFLGSGTVYEGFHTFSGAWDLSTGNYSYSGIGYENYLDNGWYETSPDYRYSNNIAVPNFQLPSGYNRVEIRLGYHNEFTEAEEDVVTLNVQTPDTLYSVVITGSKEMDLFSATPTLSSGGLLTEDSFNYLTEDGLFLYS
jgi:hypothetical protein